MRLKTVSAIGVGCLSIHALLNLTSDIVAHYRLGAMQERFAALGINTSVEPLWLLVTSMIGTCLFDGAFILFFFVLYRHQTKNVLSR